MTASALGLEGKVAVITGASRGIGRAVALELARAGAQIAAVATRVESVQETVEACRAVGATAEAYGADVSEEASVKGLAAQILERFPKIDVLVNNAGITRDQLFLRMSVADFDRVLEVNLKGPFLVTQAFSRVLLKNRGARVINIASVVGLMGNAGQANYAASKAGLIAMTKSLAKEFASRGVLVNAVAPGYVATDMTAEMPEAAKEAMLAQVPLGRPAEPREIAGPVLWLASDLSTYVTGHVLVVDGGLCM